MAGSKLIAGTLGSFPELKALYMRKQCGGDDEKGIYPSALPLRNRVMRLVQRCKPLQPGLVQKQIKTLEGSAFEGLSSHGSDGCPGYMDQAPQAVSVANRRKELHKNIARPMDLEQRSATSSIKGSTVQGRLVVDRDSIV